MEEQIIKLPAKPHQGAFGVVVIDHAQKRATKLFKRTSANDLQNEGRPWENDIRRATYQAEIAAYEAAMRSAAAKSLVPKFYGPRKLSKVLDPFGKDISDQYLLDCCFDMELLEGAFQKFFNSGEPSVALEEATRVAQILKEAGINFIKDSSIQVDASGKTVKKIIDFATRDAYNEEENKRLFGM